MQGSASAPAPAIGRLASIRRSRPFYIHIGTLFMLLVLAIQLSSGLSVRLSTQSMVLSSADVLFGHVADGARLQISALRVPIEVAVDLTAHLTSLDEATTFAERMRQVGVLSSTLERQPHMAALYIGYASGDFFLLRPLRNADERATFKVPEQTAFLVQSVEDGGQRVRWVALDAKLVALSEQAPGTYRYDPRTRPWYQEAMRTQKMVRTPPYVFATDGALGRTIALRTGSGRAVVGADLQTVTLSQRLQSSLMTPSAEMAIFDSDEGVLAYSDPARLALRDAQGRFVRSQLADLSGVMARIQGELGLADRTQRIAIDGRDWLVRSTPLQTGVSKDYLVLAAPVDELMAEATAIERRLLLITIAILLLALPLSWWLARGIASQLNDLMAQAAAIRRFDFRTDIPMATRIREIFGLGRAIGQMKGTIQKFLEVSTALASERSFDKLMERVLKEVCEAADSDGGAIYLLDEGSGTLKYVAQRWAPGRPELVDSHQDLRLDDSGHVVLAAARQAQEPVLLQLDPQRPAGLEYLNQRYGDAALQMLVIPLRGRTGNLVGLLCGYVAPGAPAPSEERMALVRAFAGAAAVAIDQQILLQSQKNLLSAFIGLVAGAIDAKSPYTGGHCQRVPELTDLLARAADASDDPAFAGFSLGEEQREAIQIAAWLHDCGKVTTPEYVVDKATKLETLYDRIHEIRMRFEVLKRDAEIATLKAVLAGGDAAVLQADLQAQWQQLDADFAFIATCNEGGEFMSEQALQRLRSIGARSWLRTLDNRLGVSWEERKRMERTPPEPLPVQESLLADKAEHVIARTAADVMPADNPWGFQVQTPQHLYNRGELYNLGVARGTLTEEERYKINDHIVQTIVMLSRLPFPQHLRGVTELAGGHHEKMDGTGYPRRLKREGLSLPARIMAVADIFEALTATDRPYKKGKTLSEAIRIMGFMVRDQHIDADIFRLLLRSGAYLAYAQKYMPPELIDTVDITPYLQPA